MKTERPEKEPICLVCPMMSDRFNMTLNPAAVNISYISFPKPASDAFPNTKTLSAELLRRQLSNSRSSFK